ncbi:MAG: hypothetical protein ACXVO9_00935, partial [Bacteroidia bacterium]
MKKNLLSCFCIAVTVLSGNLFSQQQNPVGLIQQELMRQRPHRYLANDPNVISGSMVVNANPAGKAKGIPVNQFDDSELKKKSLFFGGDTLNGFDFASAKASALNDGCKMLGEFKVHLAKQQYAYVKSKFNIANPFEQQVNNGGLASNKLNQGNSTFASACSNVDFEDGNLGGWTAVSGYNANSNNPLSIPNSALTVAVQGTNQNIYGCADVNLITSAYGNDPIGLFPGKDPNGGTTSVRLGGFNINTDDGDGYACGTQKWYYWGPANGEYIEKTISVTAANSLLS